MSVVQMMRLSRLSYNDGILSIKALHLAAPLIETALKTPLDVGDISVRSALTGSTERRFPKSDLNLLLTTPDNRAVVLVYMTSMPAARQ
ncbi:unnamed protein product [Clavelina lepadiformis]|uniref:Uncharacterized protein n=1 Tax=Clavelina lepadiformis TaxID=159417 RepID=A0ABP0GF55_CLALP